MKRPRAAASNDDFVLNLSSRLDAPASLWSLWRVFGRPIDFVADSPCCGRGGERSKRERVERGGGTTKVVSLASPIIIIIIIIIIMIIKLKSN